MYNTAYKEVKQMTLNIQPYKGARDFYPEDKRLQDYMFGVMRRAVKKFGYEEYDAPILESLDLYSAKSGQEIVSEQTYTFTDRGGRQVAIRPEMTPSVSRMVAARRQELAYPLRWFSIPNLWRYERPQRGRLREHWQINVDLFGQADLAADHEIILVADAILKEFGAKPNMYKIKLNDRVFMDFLFQDYFQLSDVKAHALFKLIDRMHKIQKSEFQAEVDLLCSQSQREANLPNKILQILDIKSLNDLPNELKTHTSVKNLQYLLELLSKSGIENAEFDITIMRGFDYYSGLVFEVEDSFPDNNRSMFGGGRYDGLVGLFGVEPVQTIGFGMGDVTLANFLESHKLLPTLSPSTDALIVLIGNVYEPAQKLISSFREMGLNLAVDATDRKIGNKLKSADKLGVRYVIFVGENELNDEQYAIKDLKTGQEEKHSAERLVSVIKDFRK